MRCRQEKEDMDDEVKNLLCSHTCHMPGMLRACTFKRQGDLSPLYRLESGPQTVTDQ